MLTREATKSIVGWLIVVGHFALVVCVLTQGEMSPDQRVKIMLTLGPIATAYFVSVVKNFIANPGPVQGTSPVNANFFSICLMLPAAFMGFIAYLIIQYPSSIADNSDSLQQWIAAIEIALGGTVGLVVDDLFPRKSV